MSLFVAGMIVGAGLVAGLLVAISEQKRAELRRRRATVPEDLSSAASQRSRAARTKSVPVAGNEQEAGAVSAITRAVAYREILDSLGDDLDSDIAEWEAVLEDFPQVIGAHDSGFADDRICEPVGETSNESAATTHFPTREKITSPNRTRRIAAEERGMIQRLMNTGFAPEEIALWLNLPLERVQEFLPRR